MASIHKRQTGRPGQLAGAPPDRRSAAQPHLCERGRMRSDSWPSLESTESRQSGGPSLAAAAVTVGEWAETWLAGQAHLKPSTLERYAGVVRTHVVPAWGTVRLDQVTHADVQAWVATLARDRSPATVRKVHRVLSLMLDLAVRDGRLPRNVADEDQPAPPGPAGAAVPDHRPGRGAGRRVRLPHAVQQAPPAGRAGQSGLPAGRAVPGLHRGPVRRDGRAAGRAARPGEAPRGHRRVGHRGAGSRAGVGHARRRTSAGRCRSRRSWPPSWLDHVAGKGPEDLVFTGVRRGQPLRPAIFRRGHFDAAAKAIGIPDLHPHELRHTAASLAIAYGADVKVVQQMLGHASATMTLDTYGHLFDNRLDEVADALDRARNRTALGE